ncbi:DUF1127 domain-containing protein [Bradyrhizobium centrolobii]|uniref:DUF1127 domain-containing protein n=1 Tax=Bradyrhizobium centrolobii TaxID=1505087 RepID=UPI001FD8BC7F|nr:DUF1127 domain-containing protein [Bradyrhizobium centrolobii]
MRPSGLTARVTDILIRSAVSSAGAISHFALTVGSVLTAEFLAGCAAHAYAIYPYRLPNDERNVPPEFASASIRRNSDQQPATGRGTQIIALPVSLRVDDSGPRPPRSNPQIFMADDLPVSHVLQPSLPRVFYASVSAVVVSLWNWIAERRAKSRALAELRALDDRALRDIGLTRFDVGLAVRGELDLR